MNGLADTRGGIKNHKFKIILAAISGLCCGMVWESEPGDLAPGYVACGALFAAGVLLPYLHDDKCASLVGHGPIVLATFSFWCANKVARTATGDSFMPVTAGYLTASLVGAFVVLAGSRLIIPPYHSFELLVSAVLVSIIGGMLFAVMENSMSYLAFAAWHCLMAAAILIAENRLSSLGESPDWR